jgi:serine/threonine protein kinase
MVQEMGSGELFALKSVSKGYVAKDKISPYLINERNALYMCNSPFVLKLYDCYCENYFLSFLLELAQGGELQDTYCRRGFYGSLPHAKYYVASLSLALAHMHEMRIAHRDVKPENVVLSKDGTAKLADMGLSKVLKGKTYTVCGTIEFLAPEILGQGGYGPAADWWALGIVTYELMTGVTPFFRPYPMHIVQTIVEGIHLVKMPSQMKEQQGDEFVKGMCADLPSSRTPMKRHGVWEIKMQHWFVGFDWQQLEMGTMEAPYVPYFKSKTDLSNFTPGHDEPPMIMYKAKSKKHRQAGDYGDEEWKKQFATST